MRLLLDTRLALWWQLTPERVPAEARSLIMDGTATAFISEASLWSLAIKLSLGRVQIDLATFRDQCIADGFHWLPVSAAHSLQVATLPYPSAHRDPFERMLVAQSRMEPLLLVTPDPALAVYGETVRVVS